MAIAQMKKVMVVSYRSQAKELLESLQAAGIIEILNAEQAMVSKEWPELQVDIKRPRDVEDMVNRLEKALAFLSNYSTEKRSIFDPLAPVTKEKYLQVVNGSETVELLEAAEKAQANLEKLQGDMENVTGLIEMLRPWQNLDTPVEEIKQLESVSCLIGVIPHQHYVEVSEKLSELGCAVEEVSSSGSGYACIIACLADSVNDAQKILRSGDFEAVSFEGMKGTVSELVAANREKLDNIRNSLEATRQTAVDVAGKILDLQILFDHYTNLLSREQTRSTAPSTESTVFFEGWVKTKNFKTLEDLVAKFDASSVAEIPYSKDEIIPVEIDNNKAVAPFEVITRLYGMPHPTDVDPTVFLAPFFALFFGICLTDAAYGLVMIAFLWWMLKKIKGDKKFFWMLILCSVATVVAGALTGGWCGDMVQKFEFFNGGTPDIIDTPFEKLRKSIMWFDPLEEPMIFFNLSLALGYLQIITGIAVGCIHKFRTKDYQGAIFDHLTWFVWLNSVAVFGMAKAGYVNSTIGNIFGVIAIVPAIGIVLFSERQGGIGGRIGMGIYNLFSTVFYVGDVLSYIRLMALGMVTGGFGMAINQITKQVMEMDVPVVGYLLGGIIFLGGHLFNIANSALGSFVHSMRLQFVEFFTKFIIGGGKQFDPLQEKYSHIKVKEE